MRRLYSICLYSLLPFAILRLLIKGFRAPAYLQRWSERFGYFPGAVSTSSVWIHAVSVGEVIAAFPMIDYLKTAHPTVPIVVTTTTPTGSERVTAKFGDAVCHAYLPYDLPAMVDRFLARTRPRLAVVMETEVWPNLYAACTDRGIPVMLANARLSPRSAAGYSRFARLTHDTLSRVSLIGAQTRADADRFIALGASPDRVKVAGNVKFDIRLPAGLRDEAARLRDGWGRARPVWIAASTHGGEEEQVLDALSRLRQRSETPLLVLVPRHPERFDRVAALCAARGLRMARRTGNRSATPEFDVFLGDTMGELPLFYAAADVAFVGGSLVHAGGHNMLEPAALGVPIVFGPHVFNFAEISQLLLTAGGALQVSNATELADTVARLLRDDLLRRDVGAKARRVVEDNRGALDRLIGWIEQALAGPA